MKAGPDHFLIYPVIEVAEFKTVTLIGDGSDGAEAWKKGAGRRAQALQAVA